MFTEHFSRYACDGDTIEAPVIISGRRTGLRLVATLYRDDDNTPPDERDEGFWPSLDPKAAGYIGAKSKATLARHTAKAQAVLDAWNNDEWHYVGVAVRAYFDELPLTDEFAHAVWGVDCNYPQYHWKGRPRDWYPNHYLRDVANDLAPDCSAEAIAKLTELVEAGAEALEELTA